MGNFDRMPAKPRKPADPTTATGPQVEAIEHEQQPLSEIELKWLTAERNADAEDRKDSDRGINPLMRDRRVGQLGLRATEKGIDLRALSKRYFAELKALEIPGSSFSALDQAEKRSRVLREVQLTLLNSFPRFSAVANEKALTTLADALIEAKEKQDASSYSSYKKFERETLHDFLDRTDIQKYIVHFMISLGEIGDESLAQYRETSESETRVVKSILAEYGQPSDSSRKAWVAADRYDGSKRYDAHLRSQVKELANVKEGKLLVDPAKVAAYYAIPGNN